MSPTAKPPQVMFIGFDVGQANDAAAYVGVVPGAQRPGSVLPVWHVAVCETAPLGVAYKAIAERARQIMTGLHGQGWACLTAADATGVGRPVVEMLRTDPHPPGDIVGVTSHGGRKLTGVWPDIGVPKTLLVETLEAVLDHQALRVPEHLPAAGRLSQQLKGYQAKRDPATGHVRYEAATEALHDDLVSGLQLAVWAGTHWYQVNAARVGLGEQAR